MNVRGLTVSLDRVLPAQPQAVFKALTTPEMFALWMGPEGSEVAVEEMTLAIGGRLAFEVTIPDGGGTFRLHGFYEEIDPPHRLVHSWMLEGDPSVSTVVFELEPHGDGTRLRLNHYGLTRPEEVNQNEAGWSHQLDRLTVLLD